MTYRGVSECEHGNKDGDCELCKDEASPTLRVGEGSGAAVCVCGSTNWRAVESFTTAAGVHIFEDDEGRRHVHDPNRSAATLECQACHRTRRETLTRTCWCGWSGTR